MIEIWQKNVSRREFNTTKPNCQRNSTTTSIVSKWNSAGGGWGGRVWVGPETYVEQGNPAWALQNWRYNSYCLRKTVETIFLFKRPLSVDSETDSKKSVRDERILPAQCTSQNMTLRKCTSIQTVREAFHPIIIILYVQNIRQVHIVIYNCPSLFISTDLDIVP